MASRKVCAYGESRLSADTLDAAYFEWRMQEARGLLIIYGCLVAVLFPGYHLVTNFLPGHIHDALSLRLISGGFSLALVLLIWLVRPLRAYALDLQLANMSLFLVLLLAILIISGNSNWYLTAIVIGLFGSQYAFLRIKDLVLAYTMAFTFQIAYSMWLGIFFHPTNLYALGAVFWASIISVASGSMRIRSIRSEAMARIRLRLQAMTDGLTGALNRNGFNESTDAALVEAQRAGDTVALVYLDLNDFKAINDAFGHDVGDEALVEATRRMRASLDEHDMLARIGGDEFVVISPRDASAAQATALIARIEAAFSRPFVLDGAKTPVCVGASAGIALYPQDGKTRLELLAHADRQMYEVKRNVLKRRSSDS